MKKFLFYIVTFSLVGLSLYGEQLKVNEANEIKQEEEKRFNSLNSKIEDLESKKSQQENTIIAYQDSISQLYRKLDGTQSLLISTLRKQKKISKEDEVLQFIQDELYPIVDNLKIEYMKYITNQNTTEVVLNLYGKTMNIPEKAKILINLSKSCEPPIKQEIHNYFGKHLFLLKTGTLIEEFKKGKNGGSKSVPQEYLSASSDLNRLIEFIITWKRNL